MLRVNQLAGFGAGKAPPLTSLVMQASAAGAVGTADAITAPADIIAGDLLVLADFGAVSTTPPATIVPAGFTAISNVALTALASGRQILSYKLATGAEASQSIAGMNGGSSQFKVLLVFRGNVPATDFTPASVNGEATANDPALQTVTASGAVGPLVVLAAYGSGSSVDPRTMSPAKDGEVACGTNLYLGWKIYNAAPANVSVDMDDEGTRNFLQSCYIRAA